VGGYPITDATAIPFPPLHASASTGGKSASGKSAKASKTPNTGDNKRKAPMAAQAGTVDKQTNSAMDSANKAQKVQTALLHSQLHTENAELPPSAPTFALSGRCLHTLPLA
jgi:hypothetical protein